MLKRNLIKLSSYEIENWNERSISQTLIYNDKKILILRLFAGVPPPRYGVKNLLAIDADENIIWVADLPESEPLFAAYVDIKIANDKILAWCGSTVCEIDPNDGNILSEMLSK